MRLHYIYTTEAQALSLHMRVQVYRTRAITSVVYGRNAENEPVFAYKMADYRALVSMGALRGSLGPRPSRDSFTKEGVT